MSKLFSWFGYAPLDNAILAWGARAIFRPYASGLRLDILPDRQGAIADGATVAPGDWTDQLRHEWKQFADIVNKSVMPALQEKSGDFSSDSREVFRCRFPHPHDDSLVLVAQGSPNGSCGYFYLSVSLVPAVDAPADVKTDKEGYREAESKREAERKEEDARRAPIRAAYAKAAKATEREIRESVATRRNGRHPVPHGDPLEVGDYVEIYRNQGARPAFVLATLGVQALIEYFMPKGTRSLQIIDVDDHDIGKPVAASRLPIKWSSLLDG